MIQSHNNTNILGCYHHPEDSCESIPFIIYFERINSPPLQPLDMPDIHIYWVRAVIELFSGVPVWRVASYLSICISMKSYLIQYMYKQNMRIMFHSSLLFLSQNHDCGSGHQIQYVIYIVFCCSQEPLQVWNTITYFTDRQSFPNSKILIYHCENFAFCRKMVSSFSLIITWTVTVSWAWPPEFLWNARMCSLHEKWEKSIFSLWHEGNTI